MSRPSIFEQASTSTEPLALTIRPLLVAAEEPTEPAALPDNVLDHGRAAPVCGGGPNGGGNALADNWWRGWRSVTILGIAPSCRCG